MLLVCRRREKSASRPAGEVGPFIVPLFWNSSHKLLLRYGVSVNASLDESGQRCRLRNAFLATRAQRLLELSPVALEMT